MGPGLEGQGPKMKVGPKNAANSIFQQWILKIMSCTLGYVEITIAALLHFYLILQGQVGFRTQTWYRLQ